MKTKVWTAARQRKLIELYPLHSLRECAMKLGVPVGAVKSRVSFLKLKHAEGYNRMEYNVNALTKDEVEFIRANYDRYTNHELARMTGRSESSVHAVRRKFRLKKENVGCFKKGSRPWNHRTKGMVTGGIETQFKKGQTPPNSLVDGAITIRFDHPKTRKGRPYKWIRIAAGKWYHYHRWVWEQANGAVLKGHVIIFKDEDTMNCDLNNLQCITMRANLARNYDATKVGHASRDLTDKYIAGRLAKGDKKLRDRLITGAPELIEMKRNQLKLKRELNK